ncbi:unnamed protein product [Protopolystoma xenopodis]|uniref:Helicase ATP-binding domain-containing protein n=1 Tax=Protopolystoma xenopodis TaxID=117903 RepID=A0A448XQ74_9PLAT|nr:unnamed protein product [Protopolystoma xenopodis]
MSGLNENVCKACSLLGWEKPFDIQVCSIKPILQGKNLVALAETGSGKTAAYALPIIHRLIENPKTYFAVVFTPTRELAIQVQSQFIAIGKTIGLNCSLLVGGIPIDEQSKQLRMKPPHVIVATPGRFMDHVNRTKGFDELKFTSLNFLVFDEADRILGSDFLTVIEKILFFMPRGRQTLLFSATMTDKQCQPLELLLQ